MRGIDLNIQAQKTPYRITPAYAGNREVHERENGQWEDHPRICGE